MLLAHKIMVTLVVKFPREGYKIEINFGKKLTFSKQIIVYLAVSLDIAILYIFVGNVTTGVTILKMNVLFARWELMLWEST